MVDSSNDAAAEPAPNLEAPRTSWRRIAPRLVVSLLIAGGFVWALRRGGLPFAPPPHAADSLNWWAVVGFVLTMIVVAYLRTARWFYLLRPLSPRLDRWHVFGVGAVGFAAVFFAPLRLGEMVRPYVMSQDSEVTFLQAVGTVAAERIIDGLVLVSMTAAALALSVPLSPLPNHIGSLPIPISLVPHTILVASVMFALAFTTMTTFYFARDRARRIVRAVVGVVSPRLAERCSTLVERLAESLGFFPSWQRSAPFLRDTLLYWFFNGVGQLILMRAVGLPATLSQGFVTMGVIGLGSLLPAGPGFFGAYQVASYTSIAMFNVEADVVTKGAMFVFISYLTHIALNASSGGVGLLLLARRRPLAPSSPS